MNKEKSVVVTFYKHFWYQVSDRSMIKEKEKRKVMIRWKLWKYLPFFMDTYGRNPIVVYKAVLRLRRRMSFQIFNGYYFLSWYSSLVNMLGQRCAQKFVTDEKIKVKNCIGIRWFWKYDFSSLENNWSEIIR